ncbi:oxidoreductase [Alsobacter soli]|uniref:Oxidoreductase n=1 Tax=Alsobacter soli TaxID=2109933 RepID=A0A2T1HPK4_9HYPH|nr:(2Fe-2S)-binding protein [Alsobacter soli]PSC03592.1 oxidoreductase [Alsobacter soli]
MTHSNDPRGASRRDFFKISASAAAVAPVVASTALHAQPEQKPDPFAPVEVDLVVNGQRRRMALDARTTLLDALRRHAGLTGAKKGCDHGQCGACTVHVGGKRTLSCLTLAVMVREPVTTIEGLAATDGALHPMQQAFIDHDAFQCGYCTPGQIMSAVACVKEGHAGSADEIREYMSGNLCRCAAYPHIVTAIQQAKTQMEG